jgi:hypothetical protein
VAAAVTTQGSLLKTTVQEDKLFHLLLRLRQALLSLTQSAAAAQAQALQLERLEQAVEQQLLLGQLRRLAVAVAALR